MKKLLLICLCLMAFSQTKAQNLLKNGIPITETTSNGSWYIVRCVNGYTITTTLDSVPTFINSSGLRDVVQVRLEQNDSINSNGLYWYPIACAWDNGYANLSQKAKYRYKVTHIWDYYDWNGYIRTHVDLIKTIPFYLFYYSN